MTLQAAKDSEIAALKRTKKKPATTNPPSEVPSASPETFYQRQAQDSSTQRTNTQQSGAPKSIIQSIKAARKRHGGIAGMSVLSVDEVKI